MDYELEQQTRQHFSKIGLTYFFLGIVTFIVQIAASLIVNAINPDLLENMNFSLLVSSFSMYFISMPLMLPLIKKIPASHIEKKKMTAGQWFIAFLMCYAVMYLSNIIGQMITTFIGIFKGNAVTNEIMEVAFDVNPWISLLVMVIFAPCVEEFFFRKLLIDRLVRYGEGCAVFITGLMFGLYHGNLNQFAYAFTIGIFFGFIYVKTGNIFYSILMHMVINFMGSVAAVALLENSGYEELLTAVNDPTALTRIIYEHLPYLLMLGVYMLILFAVVIAGIILLIVNSKKFTTYPGEIVIPNGKRFSTIFLNPGMILFVIFWIIQIIIQLFQ